MAKIQVRRDTAANWTQANPPLAAGEIGFETDTGKLKIGTGSAAWSALAYFAGSGLTQDAADLIYAAKAHTHEVAKIGDYRPDRDYAVGDTIYYEGHIWRAIKHGSLLPPDKPQGTAIVYFNAPGYNKTPYRVTEVAPAPPAGIPHTPFDMHLEYISDTNFHLYRPVGPTWQKITGITTRIWRSEGVPAIPFPNHATMWIYSAPDTSPAPVAGQNDWTSLKFNEYLSGLSDCAFEEMPHPGQALVYNGGIHRWIPGQPAFKVPDYSQTTSYSPGDTVYYQGQFWRNIWTTGQTFDITPAMTPNGAVGFFRHGGLNIGPIMAEFVEVGDPAVAPTGHVDKPLGKHYALKWQSDTSWSVWEWAIIGHSPTVWGWKKVTLAHTKTWRNFALPAPVTEEDTGQLWIYASPGTTTPPVVPQRHWEPVPLGDFLVSMADVEAINAKTGDTLVYDGHGKWVATQPAGGGGGAITLAGYREAFASVSVSNGVLTLDIASHNVFSVSLRSAITTLNITGAESGKACSLTLILAADGTPHSIVWPTSIHWPGGTAPALTVTSGKKDVLSFMTFDAGATWLGFIGGLNL